MTDGAIRRSERTRNLNRLIFNDDHDTTDEGSRVVRRVIAQQIDPNVIDPSQQGQLRIDRVVDVTPLPAPLFPTHYWVYGTLNYGWQKFYHEASDHIEAEYQKYIQDPYMFDVRSVKSGKYDFFVDFSRNIQMNVSHPQHRERPIMRVGPGTDLPPVPMELFKI